MIKRYLWFMPFLILLLAACMPAAPAPAPDPTPEATRTPLPTVTILNACDVMPERDLMLPMGEPMTIIEETTPNQMTGEFSFISRCVYAGSDPVSEALLTLQVMQSKPGIDVAPIEEIAERYIGGMEQSGLTRYMTLDEFSPAAFWLPETQTMTVFMEDGTGVTVTIEPVSENARNTAYQVVEKTLEALGY
jgi:hypothetical protein